MPVDFSGAVLRPCMDVFAVKVTVMPVASQPFAVPYEGRGVWTVKNYTILLEDGAPLSTNQYLLGIRKTEFPVVPAQGDILDVFVPPTWDKPVRYTIDKSDDDGQGGVTYTLKATVEPRLVGSTL